MIMFFGAVVAAAAAGVGWYAARKSSTLEPEIAAVKIRAEMPVVKRAVHLYFGDRQGRYLSAEQRMVDQPADQALFARRLVQALIDGPMAGKSRTLPRDARLRALYRLPDGSVVVDFDAEAFANHPGGIETELLSIYSIVNTLVLNVTGIRSVKFLIGGFEADTLAGHVELNEPFSADMMWVR
jgi:spore germination protein GerM